MSTFADDFGLDRAIVELARHVPEAARPRLAEDVSAIRRGLRALSSRAAVVAHENRRLAEDLAALRERTRRCEENRQTLMEISRRNDRVFETFRRAATLTRRMRSAADLPDVLAALTDMLGVAGIGLVLAAEDFSGCLPPSPGLRRRAAIERVLASLDPPVAPRAPYTGPVAGVPEPEFFLGGDPMSFDQRLHAGSCFIARLPDRYRPERTLGALAFFDQDPRRYSPDKGADYLTNFCEALAADIQGLKDHEQLLRDSTVDELTGIGNRTLLARQAPRLFKQAERSGRGLSILFIDLNKFKAVNDTFGHAAGDLLLTAVAQRLKDRVRGYDLLCRLGGDEFVLALPESDPERAHAVAERVRGEVAALDVADIIGRETELALSASVGMAVHRPGLSVDDLIREADRDMYREKQASGGSSPDEKP